MKPLLPLLLALPLLACPRGASTQTTSDDERLDRYVAQLEELESRTHLASECADRCGIARQGCELGRDVCDIAARHPDRSDMQRRCTAAQEACARFNDACASCQAR